MFRLTFRAVQAVRRFLPRRPEALACLGDRLLARLLLAASHDRPPVLPAFDWPSEAPGAADRTIVLGLPFPARPYVVLSVPVREWTP